MSKTIDHTGFTAPADRTLGNERRTVALAELVTTAALALSTIVAVTAVTVGIARANVDGAAIGNESGLFGLALTLGVIVIGSVGCAVLPPDGRPRR